MAEKGPPTSSIPRKPVNLRDESVEGQHVTHIPPAGHAQFQHHESTLQQPSQTHSSPFSRSKASFTTFLDKHMPSHRRYFGVKRRTFLIIILALIVALLALIIGLAAGLTAGKKDRFLPLPTDSQNFSGDLTFYGTGLGACGVTSSSSDSIVSVSHFLFDHESIGSNPNANPLCGRKIRATRFKEAAGKNRSVDLTVVDRCTGCQPTDLDVSIGVFKRLADEDLGRVGVEWAWLDE